MRKEDVIKALNLRPLEIEGGFFAEVFRSEIFIDRKPLSEAFRAQNYSASTSIYFLLGASDKSTMHAVAGDETWNFYAASSKGVHMELLVVSPEGAGEIVKLGSDFMSGEKPQYTVKAGYWMGGGICGGADVSADEAWALMGTVVAPSFEYADFVKADHAALAKLCPQYADFIKNLE